MELLLQILFEVYLNIGEILVPEKKFKKWQESLLKVTCILVSCIILAFIGFGIAMLVEGVSRLRVTAIVFLCVGSVLLAAQIALIIIVIVHETKKYKEAKAKNNDLNFKL